MTSLVLVACMLSAVMPVALKRTDIRQFIEAYRHDLVSIERLGFAPFAPADRKRLADFLSATHKQVLRMDFDGLDIHEQVDWLLLENDIRKRLRLLQIEETREQELQPHLPFQNRLFGLLHALRRLDFVKAKEAAGELDQLRAELVEQEQVVRDAQAKDRPSKPLSARLLRRLTEFQELLKQWYEFYQGYDPAFTWWCKEPYAQVETATNALLNAVRERWLELKADDRETIVGDPIGREALLAELEHEWIPYTPEQLVQQAEKEYAWCEAEMRKAAAELGYKSNWKAALEHVKKQHVEPGEQPELIRDLAFEAIEFLEKQDLVTIPALARESWRMTMLSPAQQLESPFFLGGPTIYVSYPTDGMTHEQKLMSMRGNNRHFARATVQHELIPGHHLQDFMNRRNRAYRSIFATPFWTEGWALYWEMILWDKGFAKSPEDRIGMLFWRMHRCARIVFSLSFHLGTMTPQECVDYLVDRVGHERKNAEAEVRRSFGGDYPPLYQIAYMIGGLQFRALRRELVDSGRMKEKEFHDRILALNAIPVEAVRLTLLNQPMKSRQRTPWRFLD